jgi:hypothetical protein
MTRRPWQAAHARLPGDRSGDYTDGRAPAGRTSLAPAGWRCVDQAGAGLPFSSALNTMPTSAIAQTMTAPVGRSVSSEATSPNR